MTWDTQGAAALGVWPLLLATGKGWSIARWIRRYVVGWWWGWAMEPFCLGSHLTPMLSSCKTLSKLLNLSGLGFLNLKIGIIIGST